MALVGQVANVAQLVGLDASSLITMIVEAARTVRRNRATCRQLARRVEMIGGLLRRLEDAQPMRAPETRAPVEELEETLRRAYLLVRSCQRHGYAYRCFMGARHADELREVQGEIGFYLQLFPLVSYVDATLNWVRLLDKQVHDCQEAPMVRPCLVPFLFVSCDGCCLAVVQGVCYALVIGIVHTGLQSSRVAGSADVGTISPALEPSTIEEGRVGPHMSFPLDMYFDLSDSFQLQQHSKLVAAVGHRDEIRHISFGRAIN